MPTAKVATTAAPAAGQVAHQDDPKRRESDVEDGLHGGENPRFQLP
jgi:hypothetical protein